MSQTQSQPQTPIQLFFKLTREEEEKLYKLDRKLNECPYFYHTEEYHVSHMLKQIFLDEVDVEKLSSEEREFVERIRDRLDQWWENYITIHNVDYDLDLDPGDWEEIIIQVSTWTRKKVFTVRFKDVGSGEWTLVTSEGKDLRESLIEFLERRDLKEKLLKKLISEGGFGEDNVEEFCNDLKEFYCMDDRDEECYDQCISKIDSDVLDVISDEITDERIEISWGNNPQSAVRLDRSILYGYLGSYDVHVICVWGYTKSRGGEDFAYTYCSVGKKDKILQILKEEIEDLEAIIEEELEREWDPSWKNTHIRSLKEIEEIKKAISESEIK